MVARPAAVAASAPAVERMRRLAQGALVVMTGFLLSRLLGAVRNIVIAAHFGAGPPVFARPIMDVWVAGQDAEFRDLVANLTRILLISPAVFAVSTFCSSVLNSYNRFAIAAMAPLLYNLAIIAAALLLSGPLGI